MRFTINHLILWLNDGQRRTLDFLPNKVNIITGNSATGKSSILRIIDYCFCKSSRPSKIPQEVINENVSWYGVNFTVNDTCYTLARGAVQEGQLSGDYFLSAIGEIPEQPTTNIAETEVKKRLEAEFSIDSELKIPYGGKLLKAGSKISFRYFLLFTSQSDRVINDEEQFFDKVNDYRYKEALDRIFGLALGAVDAESVLITEELAKLAKEQLTLERKEELFAKQRSVFQSNLLELIAKAQNAGLFEMGLPTMNEGLIALQAIVTNYMHSYRQETLMEANDLQQQRRDLVRRIKNIEVFNETYTQYKTVAGTNLDSLQPVQALRENLPELMLLPAVASLFNQLEDRLGTLKADLRAKHPFTVNLSTEVKALREALADVEEQLRLYPTKAPDFAEEAQRLMLVGEIKAKLELYTQVADDLDFTTQKEELASEIKQLEDKARNLPNGKQIALELLQEQIQKYITFSTSLGVYSSFRAFFNERDKTLQLRPPNSLITSDIGSSSNHLFMHLSLFLGLHDYFLQRKSRYVPQFLLLDQLSRPYYEEVQKQNPMLTPDDIQEEQLENDDRQKLAEAFKLLDNFITYAIKQQQSFQFIVLEHVSPEFLQDIGMQHVHLVENFRGGNALIRQV